MALGGKVAAVRGVDRRGFLKVLPKTDFFFRFRLLDFPRPVR